jgi:hypothetical protein
MNREYREYDDNGELIRLHGEITPGDDYPGRFHIPWQRSDLWEIAWSVVPWFLVMVVIIALIMGADSVDQIVFGR